MSDSLVSRRPVPQGKKIPVVDIRIGDSVNGLGEVREWMGEAGYMFVRFSGIDWKKYKDDAFICIRQATDNLTVRS